MSIRIDKRDESLQEKLDQFTKALRAAYPNKKCVHDRLINHYAKKLATLLKQMPDQKISTLPFEVFTCTLKGNIDYLDLRLVWDHFKHYQRTGKMPGANFQLKNRSRNRLFACSSFLIFQNSNNK